MSRFLRNQKGDPVLEAYLQTPYEEAAEELLLPLIDAAAKPTINRLLTFRPGQYQHDNSYGDDIFQEVRAQVIPVLRELRGNPNTEPISDFRSYVKKVVCNAIRSQRYQRWWRLRRRISYMLSSRKKFAVWDGINRQQICGFDTWRVKRKIRTVSRRTERLRDCQTFLQEAEYRVFYENELESLLTAIFKYTTEPVDLNDLTNLVADYWDIKDHPHLSLTDAHHLIDAHARESSIESELEAEQYLQLAWREICELTLLQRRCLLLNCKFRQNPEDGLEALTNTGGITILQISEALEIPYEQFLAMWNDLPLEDKRIAELLNMKRQDVINVRDYARQKLSHQMEKYKEELSPKHVKARNSAA